jgi:hypothetical protein
MMKLLLCLTLLVLTTGTIFAQETKVEETREVRAEKDSADAHVVTTHYSRTTEEVTPRREMLTINPIKFFVFYNLQYLRQVLPHVAVGAGFNLPTYHSIKGIGFNAEARWYPGSHALRGGYLAPTISANFLTVTDNDYSYIVDGGYYNDGIATKSNAIDLGLVLGWQWFWSDDFAIGIGLGFDYPVSVSPGARSIPFVNTSDAAETVFRLDIGYGW